MAVRYDGPEHAPNVEFAVCEYAVGEWQYVHVLIPFRPHERMYIDESLPQSPLRLRRGGHLAKGVGLGVFCTHFVTSYLTSLTPGQRRAAWRLQDTQLTPNRTATRGASEEALVLLSACTVTPKYHISYLISEITALIY